jgi:hypothetical protein
MMQTTTEMAPVANGHDTHAPLSPLTIRPATIADVPTLRQFYQALCALDTMPYPIYDDEEFNNFVRVVVEAIVTQHPPTTPSSGSSRRRFWSGRSASRTPSAPRTFSSSTRTTATATRRRNSA